MHITVYHNKHTIRLALNEALSSSSLQAVKADGDTVFTANLFDYASKDIAFTLNNEEGKPCRYTLHFKYDSFKEWFLQKSEDGITDVFKMELRCEGDLLLSMP